MTQNCKLPRLLFRGLAGGALALNAAVGCQDPLAELDPGGGKRIFVALSDGAPMERAPRVFRFKLEPAPASLDELVLFRDALSSYYRGRIAAGEVPESLAERQVPMLAWRLGTAEAFAQPSQPLERGANYSLALLGQGLLARVIIGADEVPLLERRWPRAVGGAFGGVYCLVPAYELEPFSLAFAPDDEPGDFVPFEFARDCAALRVVDGAGVRVPPPAVGGVLVDPAPLVELPGFASLTPVTCVNPCVALGPGCACAEDDRVVITGPPEPAFWALELDGRAVFGETSADKPLVVSELQFRSSYTLHGIVLDLAGRANDVTARFQTGEPQARVVINEVYANAVGPEPQQEWVELVNAGTLGTTLAGYVLEDVGGAAVLPDVELAPNGYAVVVNASYTPEPDFDRVAPADATLIVVERLGKNGLSNEGEPLRLSAPGGRVLSRFPGLRAPEPGVSAARRTPWADDADAEAFSPHGAPGASPGAANFFDAAQ